MDHISKKHVGAYTCLVSSVAGQDEAVFQVTVSTIPKVIKGEIDGPERIISKPNQPVNFHCRIDSFPPPVFQWLLVI